jgi:hypothetical protein
MKRAQFVMFIFLALVFVAYLSSGLHKKVKKSHEGGLAKTEQTLNKIDRLLEHQCKARWPVSETSYANCFNEARKLYRRDM